MVLPAWYRLHQWLTRRLDAMYGPDLSVVRYRRSLPRGDAPIDDSVSDIPWGSQFCDHFTCTWPMLTKRDVLVDAAGRRGWVRDRVPLRSTLIPDGGPFYAYALRDSITQDIFYIGKGTRRTRMRLQRVDDHEQRACRGARGRLYNRIRRIWVGGGHVQKIILAVCEDEMTAYAIEAEHIEHIGRGILLNATPGHCWAIKTVRLAQAPC